MLFPRNYDQGEKRDRCVTSVVFFREYLFCHIRAAKKYLHSRMRQKSKELAAELGKCKRRGSEPAELKTFRYEAVH